MTKTDLFSDLSHANSIDLLERFERFANPPLKQASADEFHSMRWLRHAHEEARRTQRQRALAAAEFPKLMRSAVPYLSWYCDRCGQGYTGRRPDDGRCVSCKVLRRRR